jgi:CHAT domain-containing protein
LSCAQRASGSLDRGCKAHLRYTGLYGEYLVLQLFLLLITARQRIQDGSGKTWPRIWWCPTGPLPFLPIHAAGMYGGSDPESILDYAISSYTPSVTALLRRVEDRRSIDDSVLGLLLTSQPNGIPGSPIPGTTREVQQIHETALGTGTRVVKLEGNEVTCQEFLEHLERFSSVHLACHGSQNMKNPLHSKFFFHRGTLDLSAIIKKDLKNADLAFLSACQTSAGDEKLSEEAVHLAGGMLAAGYRRVVGTMWSIQDRTAQRVAVAFYDYLFKHTKEGSGNRFDGSLSAYALHHAVQEVRKTMDYSDASLLAWTPFVHFGN